MKVGQIGPTFLVPEKTVNFFGVKPVVPSSTLKMRKSHKKSARVCALDRFTYELFGNIKECQVVLMEVYPTESMSEKKFFSNVAPSLGSGPPLIYKAKYKGLISKNQYPAITFDWSVLRT